MKAVHYVWPFLEKCGFGVIQKKNIVEFLHRFKVFINYYVLTRQPSLFCITFTHDTQGKTSAWRQKGLTGFYFIYSPFCLQTDKVNFEFDDSIFHWAHSVSWTTSLVPRGFSRGLCCLMIPGFRKDIQCHASLVPFTTPDPSIKFYRNPLITFWVMLLTNKQTNATNLQEHNFLCEGGNNMELLHDFICMTLIILSRCHHLTICIMICLCQKLYGLRPWEMIEND